MISMRNGLVITVALALCNVAYADKDDNLIVNGDFEDAQNFVANKDDSMSLLPGSQALTGWQILNASGLDVAWLGPKNPWIPAAHGQYYVDLAGYHGSTPWSGLAQTFRTHRGHFYSVAFDLGHWGTSPSMLRASAGTAVVDLTSSVDPTRNWDRQHFTFWAISDQTTLTLQGTSASNGNYLAVDHVVVKRAERDDD
ncbi:MAG: DUF642 domain-containing protein [Burkholderiaceae bacterium]|nr:DUF642 domain-containing protein [Burkholderiaceae bacterium]